jgi:hypothetical protein
LRAAHDLHSEDVFSINLADGNSDAHVGLIEDGISLNGGKGRCKKELSRNGIVAVGGCALLLALLDLASELATAETTTLDGGSTKVSCCASGVLENTALSNGDSHLAGRGNTHGLHHLLDTDSVD